MKKLFFVMLAALAIVSCQKKDEPVAQQQEVTFNPIDASIGGLKDNIFECPNGLVPDYAEIKISGTTYYSEIFYIDGVPYTKAIKLDPGNYNVQKFILWDDGGTPGNMGADADDVMVKATPNGSSDYAQWVSKTVPFQIDVNEFEKLEQSVEVLCFTEVDWQAFGFDWFQITEMTIREQCFFGDLCIKDPAYYVGSLYDNEDAGLQLDLPAIFKIEIYRGNDLAYTYDNEAWLGVGEPLCVQYADYDNVADNFTFKLYVYVAVGDDFDYVLFKTWTFDTDDYMIPAGDDEVVEFVVGNCVLDPANDVFVFPPYMNLPPTCIFNENDADYGTGGFYFWTNITGIGPKTIPGFDFYDGAWGVNCFDRLHNIGDGPYTMNVYSSLYYPEGIQGSNLPWDKANWLLNHLDQYPNATWYDFQQVLWKLEDPNWGMTDMSPYGVPAATEYAMPMYNDAMAYGSGFVPLPGGWAAIAFVNQDDGVVQLVIVRIDP